MLEKLLLLNKPADCSSFDCIRRLKPFFPKRTRIGHAGTLDPFATGLLIVCIGRGATKHLSRFMGLPKTYIATATLGEVTTTLDRTGTFLPTEPGKIPSHDDLRNALNDIGTSYEQIPPAYSALKHNGTPLYKLARSGAIAEEELEKIAQNKRRTVHLYSSILDSYEPPRFTLTATVSQGTYIRTLMHDIAQRAGGSGATTQTLHRAAIGPFSCEQALDADAISEETIAQHAVAIEDALAQCD